MLHQVLKLRTQICEKSVCLRLWSHWLRVEQHVAGVTAPLTKLFSLIPMPSERMWDVSALASLQQTPQVLQLQMLPKLDPHHWQTSFRQLPPHMLLPPPKHLCAFFRQWTPSLNECGLSLDIAWCGMPFWTLWIYLIAIG